MIIRFNVWTCDICRAEKIIEEEVDSFLDVQRTQPEGWDVVNCRGKERAICPDCVKRDD